MFWWGLRVSEMLQHVEGVAEAPGGAQRQAPMGKTAVLLSPRSPGCFPQGAGPQAFSSRPLLSRFGLLLGTSVRRPPGAAQLVLGPCTVVSVCPILPLMGPEKPLTGTQEKTD